MQIPFLSSSDPSQLLQAARDATSTPAGSSDSVDDTSATDSSTATNDGGNNAGQITSSEFMTLLVAQLQNQDPTNPVDPTTFVTQLVQFNTLEQVIDINQDLQPTSSSSTTGGTTAPSSIN